MSGNPSVFIGTVVGFLAIFIPISVVVIFLKRKALGSRLRKPIVMFFFGITGCWLLLGALSTSINLLRTANSKPVQARVVRYEHQISYRGPTKYIIAISDPESRYNDRQFILWDYLYRTVGGTIKVKLSNDGRIVTGNTMEDILLTLVNILAGCSALIFVKHMRVAGAKPNNKHEIKESN